MYAIRSYYGIGQLATFDFANVQVAADDVPEARNIIAEYEGEPGRITSYNVCYTKLLR